MNDDAQTLFVKKKGQEKQAIRTSKMALLPLLLSCVIPLRNLFLSEFDARASLIFRILSLFAHQTGIPNCRLHNSDE